MKAIFLSDAHIRDHTDPNLPPLLDFLEAQRGKIDRLFLVGDIFDTWFGFPRAVFDEYVSLLGALDAVKRSGAKIVYVTGNHDFEMGGYFKKILDADIHDTEMTLEADGLRAFIAHGDMVDSHDRTYRILRAILRCPVTRWMGRRLPPSWVWRIGQALHVTCHGDHSGKDNGLAKMFEEYAAAKCKAGHDVVILGHLHQPTFCNIGEPDEKGLYVNLGNWIRDRTFLRWDDGKLALKQWAFPEGVERRFEAE